MKAGINWSNMACNMPDDAVWRYEDDYKLMILVLKLQGSQFLPTYLKILASPSVKFKTM